MKPPDMFGVSTAYVPVGPASSDCGNWYRCRGSLDWQDWNLLISIQNKKRPRVAFRLPGYEDLPNDLEISPAAVVHPDTVAIIAPAAALAAGSVAALFQ
jgi:hypothetical protein